MAIRVGILTSGGDCPGLNATLRGVAKALYHRMGDKVEIVGIMNGYDGLINGNFRLRTKHLCQNDRAGCSHQRRRNQMLGKQHPGYRVTPR